MTDNTNNAPTTNFAKGQNVTVKLRGVSEHLSGYKGQTGTITRGGKTPTIQFDNGFETTTVRVAADSLASSVKK